MQELIAFNHNSAVPKHCQLVEHRDLEQSSERKTKL